MKNCLGHYSILLYVARTRQYLLLVCLPLMGLLDKGRGAEAPPMHTVLITSRRGNYVIARL